MFGLSNDCNTLLRGWLVVSLLPLAFDRQDFKNYGSLSFSGNWVEFFLGLPVGLVLMYLIWLVVWCSGVFSLIGPILCVEFSGCFVSASSWLDWAGCILWVVLLIGRWFLGGGG